VFNNINSIDVNDAPTIDPQYLSNPMDLEVYARHIAYLHTIAASEPFNSTILLPGGSLRDPKSNFTSLDGAKTYVEASAISMWHPCGTCAMLPEASGGVVNPELMVYETQNLRIIDASIFPLIPRGNLQPDVYAVAERASYLVKAHYCI
jgi:choline dehydrogenase-like flavoprotein